MPDELVFREEDHKYFLNGEEIPSVSELTRFLSREVYGEIDPIALDRAAERGTAIHSFLEELDKNGTVEVPSEYEGYIAAYLKFREEHDVEWREIEWMVHTDKYAGRIDRYGYVDGKPCIVDFKTTSRISKAHEVLYTAALSLYWMAIDLIKPVDMLYVIQLKSDGSYKLIPLSDNMALATSCLMLHTALTKTKRKKKKL